MSKTNVDVAMLGDLAPRHLASASLTALNAMQRFPAEYQVAAAGLLFIALLRRFNLLSGDVLTPMNNMLNDRQRTELQGVWRYAENEL